MLSNFEKGFQMYTEVISNSRVNTRDKALSRKMNEAICLMASEDMKLMKTIVVGEWVINKAFASAYGKKYNLI